MDYVENDCIKDFMQKGDKQLEENETKIWFKDMINAINYLHCKGKAHRGLNSKCFILGNNNKVILCGLDFLCISISKYDKPIGSHSYG
jgi:serine/threonine protein kinase